METEFYISQRISYYLLGLGIRIKAFLQIYQIGWSQREILLQRQQWERTRWQTWVLTSIQLDKKDRKPMDEMFPLPWDKEDVSSQTPQMSLEERRQRAMSMLNNTDK